MGIFVIGTLSANQCSVELLTILTTIPATLGLALLLQIGALKVIFWALNSRI
jgi:hypothetical protein